MNGLPRRLALAVPLLPLAGALPAEARPIIFAEHAVLSGSVGGTAFTDAAVTITAVGNTTGVFMSGAFSVDVLTLPVRFVVAGVGAGVLDGTFSLETFVNRGGKVPAVGFTRGASGSVLDTLSVVFATYDLASEIGPVTGQAFVRSDLSFATSLGALSFSDASTATFDATFVPEPPAPTLIASMAMVGLALVRPRRRR